MSYYNEQYFDWQKKVGEFGGIANVFKFNKFISPTDDVLDFGCGGGFLLNNILTSGKKHGVEINPTAREYAQKHGIIVHNSLNELPDNSIDIIISNHALEHVDNPLSYISEMKRVVRHNGKIVIVVPHEVNNSVVDNDINMHLYTWSPQNLKNLFVYSGNIEIIDACRIYHAWPNHYLQIQKIMGWHCFHLLCRIYSHLFSKYQTLVAVRVL